MMESPANLSLVAEGGLEVGLGKFPVSSGFMIREKTVPKGAPTGRYCVRVASSSFSEIVDVIQPQ